MDFGAILLGILGGLGIGELINKIFDYIFSKNRFKFEMIYRKRIEILSEIDKKIYKTQKSFQDLMSPLQTAGEPTKKEKGKFAAETANDFLEYLNENKIYLNDNLESRLDNINKKLADAWATHRAATWFEKDSDIKKWTESWNTVKDEIPSISKEIRKEFRKILGIK